MAQTVVSSKFQIVIPKAVVPERPISELRGFIKGMATKGLREKRDRL